MIDDAFRLAAVEQKLQRATRLLEEAVAIVNNCKMEEGWREYTLEQIPAANSYSTSDADECIT